MNEFRANLHGSVAVMYVHGRRGTRSVRAFLLADDRSGVRAVERVLAVRIR
jgi:hypothetical protein